MALVDKGSIVRAVKDNFGSGCPFVCIPRFIRAANSKVDCGLCQLYVKCGDPKSEDIASFKAKNSEPVPHLFTVVDRAFEQLSFTHKSQSILLTGNVGSGKTENFNLAVKSVVKLAGGQDSRIGTTLVRAHTILEALGNTVSTKSPNHSTFGQFLKVHIGSNGRISSAFLETFLLDKSSLFTRHEGERTYHIIYQIFAGMDVHKKASLYLTQPDQYALLSSHGDLVAKGRDDFDGFIETKAALDELNFSEVEQDNLFRIIAAVLHLGNLTFTTDEDGLAELENAEVLDDFVGVLLGVSGRELREALLRPVRTLAGETFMRRLNPTQALRARDSIINALYDRAFRWVVDKLNQMLKSSYDKSKDGNVPFIGLLDIPGFSEESGSFYGFCHNLMNEKLQQVYNSEIIGKKLEMLVEQVNSDAIAYSLSGKPMIDLMSSILRTLDDQAWPKKLNDESFRKALSLLLPDDSGDPSKFSLSHFAGSVPYEVSGWVSLNDSTAMEDNVEDILRHSSSDLVVDVLDTFRPPNPVDGEDYVSVSKEFLTQLDGIFQQILRSQRHFIRCLRSSDTVPEKLDEAFVGRQIEFFGVEAGAKLHQKFSCTIPFSAFGRKYGFKEGGHDIKEWDRENILRVVQDLVANVVRECVEPFLVGKSKVFVTGDAFLALERERKKRILEKVEVLQAATRGFIARKKLVKTRSAAILQKVIRRFHAMCQDHWTQLWMATSNLLQEKYENEIIIASTQSQEAHQELQNVHNRNRNLGSRIDDMKREIELMQAQLTKTNSEKAELLTNMSSVLAENIRLTQEISKRLDKK